MSWTIALGAGAVIAYLLHDDDPDHHDVVEATYDALNEAAPADATVYADHVDHAPNPHTAVDGLEKIPDVVVKSGIGNSMLIEVETADSLENSPAEAKEQLIDFSKRGYRRILVVPKQHEDAAREFADKIEDDLPGEYYLAAPGTVANLL